jgi:hypothetical protein
MLLLCKVNLKSQKNCSHHHRGKPSGLLWRTFEKKRCIPPSPSWMSTRMGPSLLEYQLHGSSVTGSPKDPLLWDGDQHIVMDQ